MLTDGTRLRFLLLQLNLLSLKSLSEDIDFLILQSYLLLESLNMLIFFGNYYVGLLLHFGDRILSLVVFCTY